MTLSGNMGRKLWFLLVFENMLKSIATARSECTAKYESKASYNTGYIVPDLIDFFDDDWKEIKIKTEKRNIHNCTNIVLTKNWFVVSNFLGSSKHHIEKIMFWPCVFPTKIQIHYFQNFLVTKYLKQVFLYRNYFRIFVLRCDVFKLIKNRFVKIKKQLMLTNFSLAMYKIAEKY